MCGIRNGIQRNRGCFHQWWSLDLWTVWSLVVGYWDGFYISNRWSRPARWEDRALLSAWILLIQSALLLSTILERKVLIFSIHLELYTREETKEFLYLWRNNNKTPHSSTLAWKIPRMEEPGGLQYMGSRRVGHDWATSLSLSTFMHWRRKWQPTPVFLPGESQGRGSLVGRRLWGRTESDTTEAT